MIGRVQVLSAATLSMEYDIVRKLNVHGIIEQFAQMKCRKSKFYQFVGNTAFVLFMVFIFINKSKRAQRPLTSQ